MLPPGGGGKEPPLTHGGKSSTPGLSRGSPSRDGSAIRPPRCGRFGANLGAGGHLFLPSGKVIRSRPGQGRSPTSPQKTVVTSGQILQEEGISHNPPSQGVIRGEHDKRNPIAPTSRWRSSGPGRGIVHLRSRHGTIIKGDPGKNSSLTPQIRDKPGSREIIPPAPAGGFNLWAGSRESAPGRMVFIGSRQGSSASCFPGTG